MYFRQRVRLFHGYGEGLVYSMNMGEVRLFRLWGWVRLFHDYEDGFVYSDCGKGFVYYSMALGRGSFNLTMEKRGLRLF